MKQETIQVSKQKNMIYNVKRTHIVLFIFIVLGIAAAGSVIQLQNYNNYFENKIIAATNRIVPAEGQCDIDLSALFTDFEWNTASIFIGGNSKQIREALQFDNDISDGIVFANDEENVMVSMSIYDFLHDELPKVGYTVNRTQNNDLYYTSRPREQAILHVEKFRDRKGKYKYLVYFQ